MKNYKAKEAYHTTYNYSKKGKKTSEEIMRWICDKFRITTHIIIEATGMYKYFDTITFDFTKDYRHNEK